MAQRVTSRHTLITGRMQLFTPEWRVLTNDPWIINAIQGHTIDLKGQSTQYQTPRELIFSQEEERVLSEEVRKMVSKQAIIIPPVTRDQAVKGFQF